MSWLSSRTLHCLIIFWMYVLNHLHRLGSRWELHSHFVLSIFNRKSSHFRLVSQLRSECLSLDSLRRLGEYWLILHTGQSIQSGPKWSKSWLESQNHNYYSRMLPLWTFISKHLTFLAVNRFRNNQSEIKQLHFLSPIKSQIVHTQMYPIMEVGKYIICCGPRHQDAKQNLKNGGFELQYIKITRIENKVQ